MRRHSDRYTMMHLCRLTAVAIVLGTAAAQCAYAGAIDAQYCGAVPALGFDLPPNHAYTGRYVNAVYGYAVTIPPGLTAYSSAQGPQRGFGIVLSWAPRAYLRVDAAYDAFYDITADGVHLRDVIGVRLFDTLLSDQKTAAALAGVAGGRYQMRVRCPGSAQIYVHDAVIVMRRREIYRLDLQTVPSRHASDVKWLEAMLPTWQWVPVQPQ
ncbi:MAG TPA: hypothetical protein VHX52_03130 [Steroidobacteraceae bacterium]|jgi:hypothetical protein|nr:hypothetical protein [Steroidobacteraceae bacterium]